MHTWHASACINLAQPTTSQCRFISPVVVRFDNDQTEQQQLINQTNKSFTTSYRTSQTGNPSAIEIPTLTSSISSSTMVITFNTRFQDIKRRCAPLLGKRRLGMQLSDITASTKITGNASREKNSRETEEVGHLNRHKRQKQELAYMAATIDQTLEEAGRPTMSLKSVRRERALPTGSVDLSLAQVISASEYDSSTAADSNKNEDEKDVYYKAFYTSYSSLIQSTRLYYNSSLSESKFANDENEKKSESSSSMEGLSSWTPNSSNHDLNDNKDIDNDNRSDQSSLDAEGSISDNLSEESRKSPPNVTSKNGNETDYAAYSVVG